MTAQSVWCEWANGRKGYFLNGVLHRVDCPAVENADGTKHWYLKGEEVQMEDVIKNEETRLWWRMKSDVE